MVDPIQPNTVFSQPQQSDVTGQSLNTNVSPLSPRVFSFNDYSNWEKIHPATDVPISHVKDCFERGYTTGEPMSMRAAAYLESCLALPSHLKCSECWGDGFILHYDSVEDGRGCYEVACLKCRRAA